MTNLSRLFRDVEKLVKRLTGRQIPSWAWLVLWPVLVIGWVLRWVWESLFGG